MSSFVSVSWTGGKTKDSKKVLIPPSMNGLKLQLARLFGLSNQKDIETITDSDGNVITSISSIEPGMHIMFTTKTSESNNSEDEICQLEEIQEEQAPRSPPKKIVGPKKILRPPPNSMKPPKVENRHSEQPKTIQGISTNTKSNNLPPNSNKSSQFSSLPNTSSLTSGTSSRKSMGQQNEQINDNDDSADDEFDNIDENSEPKSTKVDYKHISPPKQKRSSASTNNRRSSPKMREINDSDMEKSGDATQKLLETDNYFDETSSKFDTEPASKNDEHKAQFSPTEHKSKLLKGSSSTPGIMSPPKRSPRPSYDSPPKSMNDSPRRASPKRSPRQSYDPSTAEISHSPIQSIDSPKAVGSSPKQGGDSPKRLLMVDNNPKAPKRALVKEGQEITPEEMIDQDEIERRRLAKQGISHDAIIESVNKSTGEIICNDKEMRDALYKSSPIVVRFMTNVAELEMKHITQIIKSELAFLGEIPEHPKGLDNAVEEFINEFETASGSLNLHTAIIGPKKSGRSTILKLSMIRSMIRMAASGVLRRTFTFYLDANELLVDDIYDLYLIIVRKTIEQIAAQRIDFCPHAQLLLQYYEKMLTQETLAALPIKFSLLDDFRSAAFALNEMNQILFDAFKKKKHLPTFVKNALVIPLMFSLAFGFERIIFFVDHLDNLDIDCPTNKELIDDGDSTPLVEYAKMMLSDGFYVISCADEERLLPALDTIADDGVELISITELRSVSEICQNANDEHDEGVKLSLNVEGEKKPVVLGLEQCGYCPAFVAEWDRIAADARKLSNELHTDSKSRKAVEAKLLLLKKVRNFSSLVFGFEDPQIISDFEITLL